RSLETGRRYSELPIPTQGGRLGPASPEPPPLTVDRSKPRALAPWVARPPRRTPGGRRPTDPLPESSLTPLEASCTCSLPCGFHEQISDRSPARRSRPAGVQRRVAQ